MTIKEIAKMAGVSTATVSYVLNNTKNITEEKRRRVLEAVEQSGYKPNPSAKSLRAKRTNNIGVLLEDILGFPTPAIINGISEYVESCGYHILLNDLRMLDSLFNRYDQILQQKDKINEAISLLLFGANVEAIIYVGMFDREITGVIREINKPLVFAYSTSKDANCHCVTYENEIASAEAARYLLRLGHRRIAVITGLAHTAPARTRLRGVQTALHEAGIVLDASLVKNGDWEYESGCCCMQELLSQGNRPTAVLAMNDLMAVGAMNTIQAAGLKIPEDISVIGFDNREIASYVSPSLTTVRIDLKEIGRTAAETAVQQIRSAGAERKNLIIPSAMVLRETVAAPKERAHAHKMEGFDWQD